MFPTDFKLPVPSMPPISKVYPQGPRDLYNRGKNPKYLVIPDFFAIKLRGHKTRDPDGTITQLAVRRTIPLYTLAPHGKVYNMGKKRGGLGGVR